MFNLVAPGLSDRLFVGRLERLIERYTRGLIDTIDVGNLNHRRDYVSAPDAIAQVRSIAARGVRGQIYNVGSGFAVPIRDVLHRMLDAAGVSRESIREAIATPGGHSGYDVPVIFADMRRTRALQQ
jgi:GDP-4-dehydro-6-deoxy-D-mannose reductase